MRRVILAIRYCGEEYHGWQMQKNAVSIQETLHKAIVSLFSDSSIPIGCSRTDAGVHANIYCCSFNFNSNIDCEKLILAINSRLPHGISVLNAFDAPPDFHPTFDCLQKEYIYKIHSSSVRDPFLKNRALFYPFKLDANLLNIEAKSFIGTHDFSAFMAVGGSSKTTIRTVSNAKVWQEGSIFYFKVSADGFLYNMVRIMTGTLLYIGRGKLAKDSILEIIQSGKRENAGITVPPEGLYLNGFKYDTFEANDGKLIFK